MRLETLGDYKGNDGLVAKDLPDMVAKDGEVSFTRMPALVVVRPPLSKGRHQYFTFLSEEGCEYLKDYLEERIRSGEKLTSGSPIVTPKLRMKPFIRATNIGDMIRKSIRKAGLKWRPYVLRSYFDTQLMLAESKGLPRRWLLVEAYSSLPFEFDRGFGCISDVTHNIKTCLSRSGYAGRTA